jgi:hypothetical protein
MEVEARGGAQQKRPELRATGGGPVFYHHGLHFRLQDIELGLSVARDCGARERPQASRRKARSRADSHTCPRDRGFRRICLRDHKRRLENLGIRARYHAGGLELGCLLRHQKLLGLVLSRLEQSQEAAAGLDEVFFKAGLGRRRRLLDDGERGADLIHQEERADSGRRGGCLLDCDLRVLDFTSNGNLELRK